MNQESNKRNITLWISPRLLSEFDEARKKDGRYIRNEAIRYCMERYIGEITERLSR